MRDALPVKDYWPRSELVVPEHRVQRARFPVVDAHNHLPMGNPERTKDVDLDELVRSLADVHVQTFVNLSGGWGDELKLNLEKLDQAYPDRFITFCNVDWSDVGQAGWLDKTQRQLAADVAAGARGLKVFKTLGLSIRDDRQQLVMPDDPRIADVWEQAAALDIPVLIHVADPVAFFRPLDRLNERWEQLHLRPEWHFYGPEFPSFQEIIDSLYRTIETHPRTTFITAHVGCYPENLAFVSQMLDRYPNMYTDISARLAELGRAPYSARKWFTKYADRILFGTDQTPRVERYRVWFRALETDDEYFDYVPEGTRPGQGRWKIYGLYLPDDVLHKVYHDNAARILKLS